MKLSDEQRTAVRHAGHLSLASCPGSGKTRTVAAKLLHCLDSVRNTSRRIGCITYTNAAVNEIEARLRSLCAQDDEQFIEISTIHSFCLTHILRPHHHLLPEFDAGFQVFAPDQELWQTVVAELIRRHRLDGRRADSFERIERLADGTIGCPPELSAAAAKEFIAYCDDHRLMPFSDIVYHSYRIVKKQPAVPRGIASRFAWLLIDEFQDTTEVQVELFKTIASFRRTTFFLVGDPNQSIMSFAGGHPRLMGEFATHLNARCDVTLAGNYRSSTRIVVHAERICPCNPPMRAEGPHRDFHADPEYVHATSTALALFEHFIPATDSLGIPLGEAAILAPAWTSLYHIARELRKKGVPVLGPGARPYRRSHEFSRFAENACAYIEEQRHEFVQATQKALFLLLNNLSGTTNWQVYSYEGKKVLFRILKQMRDIAKSQEAAERWLLTAATAVAETLVGAEYLTEEQARTLPASANGMVADMKRNGVDTANLALADIGLFAQPSRCLNLLTLHSSKGREFDAVAMVDLHEGRIPHFSAKTQDEFEEARRLFYVGVTRARKLLMYFTDSTDTRNRPTRFLGRDGIRIV